MEDEERTLERPAPPDRESVKAADEATVVLKRLDGGTLVPGTPIPPDTELPEIPDCQLLSILGSGGMGVVYLGRQISLDRFVAVKMLNSQYSKSPEFVERLRQEARIMGAMDHPNVVGCHDIICQGDNIFIIMEYIPGRFTGRDLVLRFGPIPEKYVVSLLCQVVSGLAFVYAKGFIHRDLKPDNLLFFRETPGSPHSLSELFEKNEPRVLICDFGLAVPQRDLAAVREEKLIGSLAFMSPEQLDNTAEIDFRSDMYSLAATAYYLLSGRPPFSEIADRNARVEAKLSQDLHVRDLRRSGPLQISRSLARILGRLGALDPSRRYQDYGLLLRDLRELELYNQTGVNHMASMMGRHFLHWLGASFIVVLVVVSVLAYLVIQLKYQQSWHSNPDLSSSLVHWDFPGNGSWRLQSGNNPHDASLVGLGGSARLHARISPGRILAGRFRIQRARQVVLSWRDQDDRPRVKLTLGRRDEETLDLTLEADGRDVPLADGYHCGRWSWLSLVWEIHEDNIVLKIGGQLAAVCPLSGGWDGGYFQIDGMEDGGLEIRELVNI